MGVLSVQQQQPKSFDHWVGFAVWIRQQSGVNCLMSKFFVDDPHSLL